MTGPDFHKGVLVVVSNDGNVLWVPPVKLVTSCTIDSTTDVQTCDIKMGSWAFDGNLLNLLSSSSTIDVSTLSPSEKWQVTKTKAVRHVIKYECCPEPYIDVTFSITLKNKSPSFWGRR